MKTILTLSVSGLICLTGCIHSAAPVISGNTFKGDPALSLGGNMELLAGNQSVERKNADQDAGISSGDYATASAVAAEGAASLTTAGALTGGLLALSMTMPESAVPEIENVVFLKTDPNENPSSEQALRKAYLNFVKQDAPEVKQISCNMVNDGLSCSNSKGSQLFTIKYTYFVDPVLMRRIDPSLPAGIYAAYGIDEDRGFFKKPVLKKSSYKRTNHWTTVQRGWIKEYYVNNTLTVSSISYYVDHRYEVNNKTVVKTIRATKNGPEVTKVELR